MVSITPRHVLDLQGQGHVCSFNLWRGNTQNSRSVTEEKKEEKTTLGVVTSAQEVARCSVPVWPSAGAWGSTTG